MGFKAIILFTFALTVTEGYRSYLYSPNDKLIITLNRNTFFQEILRKSNAFIVQFYASWCGHCIRFSSHFQRFSRDIVGWNDVIKLAVVNCADYTNVDLCTHFGVQGFPTIRFFGPFVRKGDLGQNVNLLERSAPALVDTAAFLLKNYSFYHKIPLDWPELRSVDKINFDYLDEKPVLAVIESNTSLIGTQVILDLSSFDDYIAVFRTVSNKNATKLLPLVKRIYKTGKREVIYRTIEKEANNSNELRRKIVMEIRKAYLSQVWPLRLIGESPVTESTTTVTPKIVKEYNVVPVNAVDLYNAVHYALYNEVMLKKRLNTTRIEALHRFLIAIIDHFPFTESNGRAFFEKLIVFIDDKMARKMIPGSELRHAIRRIERENALPPPKQWKSCAGSVAHLRGYPCSLWLLFHTLTVSEHLKAAKSGVQQKSSSVLTAISEYVKNFYSCKFCVQHFNEMLQKLDQTLQSLYDRSAVLWLWWAHNQVNQRLKGDESEDPAYPKIQFPPRKACVKCRKSNSKWDQKEVLQYMSEHYNTSSIQ